MRLTESSSDGQPSLSTDFRAAVAGPFYLRNLNSQKAFVRQSWMSGEEH